MIDKHEIRHLAALRTELHRGQASQMKFGKDADYIGLLGEFTFAEEFGMAVDLNLYLAGDGYVDFYSAIGTIDVKTYRKAYHLPRVDNKPHADILVLGDYDDERDEVELIGWEYDRVMLMCPKWDYGFGLVNHSMHRTLLHPLEELHDMINKRC